MEFTQHTCPVCEKRFENGDDIVVCPECGAPHHRECYEKTDRCFYEDKHGEGFSFENIGKESAKGEEQPHVTLCPRCKAENEKTSFYCGNCGFPLHSEDRNGQQNSQQNSPPPGGIPFGFGAAGAQAFDPLAGMNSEEEIADGVKVGEAAKFIGKSTPYYLSVFSRIRKSGSGRFHISAFFLTGAYFLYRKMYVPGIILSLLMMGIVVGSAAIMLSNPWLSNLSAETLTEISQGTLGADKMAVLFLSAGLSLLRIGVMVFSGLLANKLYYAHSISEIKQIKSEAGSDGLNKELEQRGGVNLPMAAGFFTAYFVIYEICNIYLMMQSF